MWYIKPETSCNNTKPSNWPESKKEFKISLYFFLVRSEQLKEFVQYWFNLTIHHIMNRKDKTKAFHLTLASSTMHS